MSKIKSISSFDKENGIWEAAIPLGADDINIDITSATEEDPDDEAISDIPEDSNTALDTEAVIVLEGDTEATAWTKFNRFRKRVINNFNNYLGGVLLPAWKEDAGSDEIYAASVLNDYMSNVIGIEGTSAMSFNNQEQTLKDIIDNYIITNISRSGLNFTATNSKGNTVLTFNQQDNNTTYSLSSLGISGSAAASAVNYKIGNIRIEAGETRTSSGKVTVTFTTAFKTAPIVVVSAKGDDTSALYEARPANVTYKKFDIYEVVISSAGKFSATPNTPVVWIAVGQA